MLYNNLTEQQKRDMIVSDLNRNMFVEAGAGAGKTTLIVERIINQLKQGFKPREIVAITFTNAATHELKERIISKAHEVSLGGNLSEEERQNLKEALDTIDQMQISTIHSFCSRLLKESSLAAGLPMGMHVIEEDEVNKLKEISFTRWAEGLKRDDWNKLIETGRFRSSVLAYLKSLTEQIISVPNDTNICIFYDDVSEEDFIKGTQALVDDFSRNALENIFTIFNTGYRSVCDIPNEHLTSYGSKVKAAFISGDRYEIVKTIGLLPTTKSFFVKLPSQEVIAQKHHVSKKDAKTLKDNYSSDEEKFADLTEKNCTKVIPLIAGFENAKYRPYVELAKDAAKYFFDSLDAAILTNDLLIQKTYELLLGSEETAQYLGNKFRCIYVDEFQDTDHAQDAFIRLLVQDATDRSKIRNGSLFVVGDPKQSIYRFRGAEPEVYFSTKEIMASYDNAAVIELRDNFRSNPQIITWVNKNFTQKDITPQTVYVPMNAKRQVPQDLDLKNVIHGVYTNNDCCGKNDIELIGEDVSAVTNLILNLVNGDYKIIDYDKNSQAYTRKIKFSDFLILCANTDGMSDYADAFKAHGIPVVMDSKTILGNESYMQNFLRLYKLLVDPYNYINQVAAEEGLKRTGITAEEAIGMIQLLMKSSNEMSDVAKLRFLQENWLVALTKNQTLDSSRLLSAQARITQMVENALFSSPGNGIAIVESMTVYLEKELGHELVLNDKADAVRFMNLHKAKGLEGNIVIWTNRREKRTYRAGSIRKGKDYYPVIKNSMNTVVWGGYNREEQLIDSAKAADATENIRLEYVACTRPKQALIFMKKYGKGPVLFDEGYDFGDRSVKEIIDNNDSKIKQVSSDDFTISINKGTKFVDDCPEARPVMISESPSDFENESAGQSGKSQTSCGGIKRPSGNIFGLVMHRAFELMVERLVDMQEMGIDSQKLIKVCCTQAINENIDDIPSDELKDYRLFVQEIVKAFFVFWEEENLSAEITELYTEMPFTYIYDDGDKNKPVVWRHGTADLVLRLRDGNFLVIDYKSDNDENYIDEEAFVNRLQGKYAGQINRYKEAVSKAFDVEESAVKACLVSFSLRNVTSGDQIRVRVTEVR